MYSQSARTPYWKVVQICKNCKPANKAITTKNFVHYTMVPHMCYFLSKKSDSKTLKILYPFNVEVKLHTLYAWILLLLLIAFIFNVDAIQLNSNVIVNTIFFFLSTLWWIAVLLTLALFCNRSYSFWSIVILWYMLCLRKAFKSSVHLIICFPTFLLYCLRNQNVTL